MNSVVLNNDVKMPMPGSRVTDQEACERSVFDAINTGLYYDASAVWWWMTQRGIVAIPKSVRKE